MFINITTSETGNNKGSSGQLVHYLDKENRLFSEVEQLWFNNTSDSIESYLVRSKLDGNVARLCKDDAKFFLVNISPSQKELGFLIEHFGEELAKEKLKDFAFEVMDEYAKNFNRSGIVGNEDLLWFAKLEHHRYYSFRDKVVKEGLVKAGTVKPGGHWHVQVIVSRKDITNSIKLSPMNKSRGKNIEHSKKLGQFDRSAFKQSGERLFDEMFGFNRDLKDTFRYANIQKNGNLEQKLDLHKEIRKSGLVDKEVGADKALKLDNLLEILLRPEYGQDSGLVAQKKPKRKREQEQDQSYGRGI
ncbi:DUF5712 family protein [Pedobacter sp. UC225_65]|uniref:DUF5712 family protein n=1 Tax=Pedobacter sp. UC225_65 TaxID=3350173 RepID=UPI00366AB6B2